MAKQEPRPSLKDLDARLKKAREAGTGLDWRKPRKAVPTGGLGLAMRLATELVAALAVGIGIGVLLDSWLGTRPWLTLVFFFLGAGAAGLNVYRVTAGFGYAAGYRRKSDEPNKAADNRERGNSGTR